MSAPESGHDALAWWAAGLTMLVWSSSYPAITFGLRAFTPEELVVLRFLTASLCFAVPVALGWIRLPPRRDWPAVVLLALIGNVCYQLALCTAMTRISAGSAAVVIALVPAVTAVLAVLRLGETLSLRAIAGLLVAFAGTLLVTVGRGHDITFDPLALLAFVAVLCSSSFFVWQKPLLTRTSPVGFTAATLFVATVVMLPLGWHLPGKILSVPHAQIWAVLYLGLVPTVIGFFCWSFALSRAPASRISSLLYLQPVGAFLLAWLWLDEIPAGLTVLGALLAIGGVILATTRIGSVRSWRGSKRTTCETET